MPETKQISTVTEFTSIGTNISIKTSYNEGVLPDTIEAFLADSVGSKNGVNYIEGGLVLTTKNSPQNLNYSIDSNGHLVLVINTGDGLKYSVDSNGHLIYIKD